ncbi:hypothetical protein L486_03681 [Kwoniella mangroviensis CBS 10435]|uniref:Uncharacterized protein n=1 Tax=Kwoniella mangroviensis CBS 10435 TaxID=1331196 RepID=A0A1B9IUG4_9TREE|nr:hypothetical protein L486_03681 [Kwoniella mangroviensis CBS 10435]OCF76568.1 hypothetical protein I204_02265 [Kwoniella mangroviensis CBS 8886]
MAQGGSKNIKSKSQSGGSARKKAGKTKPGKRDVAPKDKHRIAERVQKKQLSSKINNNIEKQMVNAASAGKLTIMRNSGDLEAQVIIIHGAGKDQGKGKGKA